MPDSLSLPTLRRLPLYLQYLIEAQASGRGFVSATEIAAALKVHHTQVRQDFEAVGARGFPKRGHPIEETICAIERFFGGCHRFSAFLVGAGNLGRALVGYRQLESAGIRVLAVFDKDSRKVGTKIAGIDVFAVTKFAGLVQRMRVDLAILALPPSAADDAVELVSRSGIRAVWNFIPATLRFPPEILVENVNIVSSLAVLARKLTATNTLQEVAHDDGTRTN